MAIELAENYTDKLDELYRYADLFADLGADPTIVQAGVDAGTVRYPDIRVSGLGNYNRGSANGYETGTVTNTFKTMSFNYDRGEKIPFDVMDNQEAFDILSIKTGSELVRTQVVPEHNAFTASTLVAKAYSANPTNGTAEDFTTAEMIIAALRRDVTKMDELEVTKERRILYITPTLKGMIEDLDTNKSREVLNKFYKVVEVPQSRFYTAIDLKSMANGGGYAKSATGLDLNYLIVDIDAVIKYAKHNPSQLMSPEQNPDSDGFILKYRLYGIVDVYENKAIGIFYSHKTQLPPGGLMSFGVNGEMVVNVPESKADVKKDDKK